MQKIEVFALATVVGILGVISGFLVLNARAQLRDVTRIAHMREMQIGLELFFMEKSTYPEAESARALGQSATACLGTEGFSTPCAADAEPFVAFVPEPPVQGLKKLSQCEGNANAYCYTSDGATFRLQFELESAHAQLGLTKGVNCLTENSFLAGACSVYAPVESEAVTP